MVDAQPRLYSTGIGFLDEMLGGGIQPGTLTLLYGATGVGKTQIGLQFLDRGASQEGHRGTVVDFTTRGDAQQHGEYASRLFGWRLQEGEVSRDRVFDGMDRAPDLFRGLEYCGQRVTREDLSREEWNRWQSRLVRRTNALSAFLYAHFVRGVRRVLVDGVEPVEKASDSIQMDLIEFLYQQLLRTDFDWVARNLFREAYLANEDAVMGHAYDKDELAAVVSQTSSSVMLHDLIERDIPEGDLATNATTILLLGRVRRNDRISRGAFVLKNRGMPCSEEIVPYRITERGVVPE